MQQKLHLYIHSLRLTNNPSITPTFNPSNNPTMKPTFVPTNLPTYKQQLQPTMQPTNIPTHNPIRNKPTIKPISNPTELRKKKKFLCKDEGSCVLECGVEYSCCLCSAITCGHETKYCDTFKSGADYAAFGVQQINGSCANAIMEFIESTLDDHKYDIIYIIIFVINYIKKLSSICNIKLWM